MASPENPEPTLEQEDDDEALAERLADLWVEWAQSPGPHRLRAMKAAGLLPEETPLSQQAAALGLSPAQTKRLASQALKKLRLRLSAELDSENQ